MDAGAAEETAPSAQANEATPPASAAEAAQPGPAEPTRLRVAASAALLWRDPALSGVVFALGNAAFGAAALGRVSAPALLGKVLLYALLLANAAALLTRALQASLAHNPVWKAALDSALSAVPPSLSSDEPLLPPHLGSEIGTEIAACTNGALAFLKRAGTATDGRATAAALAIAIALKLVGPALGLRGVLHLAFVLAFAVPKLWQTYGAELTSHAEIARDEVCAKLAELQEAAVQAAPPALASRLSAFRAERDA